ncbi:MAG: GNAT family N-acetyltransferase [Nitrospiraceae bacterium]
MQLRIDHAQSTDAPIIAQMVGELLHEIMASIGTKAFRVDREKTEARARFWIEDGTYIVLLARDGAQPEPLGFLALYECYALYAEGSFGTIPELFVRPAYRSSGVGATLISEAQGVGQARGWSRIEVTTPPLPQFDRTLAFYQQQGFSISGGRKLKIDL